MKESEYFFIGMGTPSSKSGRIYTGAYSFASEAVQNWQKYTNLQFRLQKERFLNVIKELEFPLYIEFTFIRKSRHKWDYINAQQTIQDEMVFHGWLTSDDTTIIKPYFGDAQYNPNYAGCIIRVLKTKPII